MADINFYKYLEEAFRYKLYHPEGKRAAFDSYYTSLGYNLTYDRIFFYARKILPKFYTQQFPDTREGNLQMAKKILEKLDKHQDIELESQFKVISVSEQDPQIIASARAESQAEPQQAPSAGNVGAGFGLPTPPSTFSSSSSRPRVIHNIPQTPPKPEIAVANKSGAVIEKPPPKSELVIASKSGVVSETPPSKIYLANKSGAVTGEHSIKSKKFNFSSFKSSFSSFFKGARNFGSRAGVFFQRNAGKYLTVGRIASVVSAGFGAVTGWALTNHPMGMFGGGIGGAVLPSFLKSREGVRFLGRVGNGIIDRGVRFSNQVSSGSARFSRYSSKGSKRLAWGLIGSLIFFSIFAGAIGNLPEGSTPPAQANPISAGRAGCPDTSTNKNDSTCRYLNPSINIFDTQISQQSIDRYIQLYKNYFVGKKLNDGTTGTEEEFKRRVSAIVTKAQSVGMNPALFLGFWKSESAFSTVGRAGNDLGCRPNNPEITNFDENLLCAAGLRSDGKTYEPSITVRCTTSKDTTSSFCQSLKQGRASAGYDKTHPINYPISTFDDFMEAYGPYDHLNAAGLHTNCTHTYNTILEVSKEVDACKQTAPSVNSNDIVYWAKRINDALEPGLPPSSYNKMMADISNGSYSSTKRSAQDRGVSPTGIYWCTNIVIDSYNLAGISGLGPTHQGVRSMMDFWKSTSGYNFIAYGGLPSLKETQPGFALFRIYQPNYEYDHVSIIQNISIDDRGNGDIKTLDSNSIKGWSSTIRDGKVLEGTYFKSSIVGFGGYGGLVSKPPTTKPIIVLDPGHSGSDIDTIDAATGLRDHDYPNIPEITEVFAVVQLVKNKLEADGYTVIMTKNSARDNVSLRKRADIANNANALLAVSIHNDHSAKWDNFAQVYVQQVGLYRQTKDGKKITFDNEAVAQKSQQYGQIFAQEREKAEGRSVSVTNISFAGRLGLDPGNIPLVQLFATVPWVYNEVGVDGDLLSPEKLNIYAQGIINAIKKSVPITQP